MAPPSVFVVDIAAMRRRHETHLALQHELDVAWMAEVLADTDATVEKSVAASLGLVVQGDGSVIVTGRIKGGFHVPCARCLDPAEVVADTSVAALYVQEGAARRLPDVVADDDVDDDDDDDDGSEDVWPFDGVTLDLRPMLAETLKLAYPMRALCVRKEACRGLCSQCGAPLNEQPETVAHCQVCGVADPKVPEVDTIPSEAPQRGHALADALREAQTRSRGGKARLPE